MIDPGFGYKRLCMVSNSCEIKLPTKSETSNTVSHRSASFPVLAKTLQIVEDTKAGFYLCIQALSSSIPAIIRLNGEELHCDVTSKLFVKDVVRVHEFVPVKDTNLIFFGTNNNAPVHFRFQILALRKNTVEEIIPNIAVKSYDACLKIVKDHFKDDLVEKEVVSLYCTYSLLKIKHPVKSVTCKHLGCLDRDNWLGMVLKTNDYRCPICTNPLRLDDMYVDTFFENLITNNMNVINKDGTFQCDDKAVKVHDTNVIEDVDDDTEIKEMIQPKKTEAPKIKSYSTPDFRELARIHLMTSEHETQQYCDAHDLDPQIVTGFIRFITEFKDRLKEQFEDYISEDRDNEDDGGPDKEEEDKDYVDDDENVKKRKRVK